MPVFLSGNFKMHAAAGKQGKEWPNVFYTQQGKKVPSQSLEWTVKSSTLITVVHRKTSFLHLILPLAAWKILDAGDSSTPSSCEFEVHNPWTSCLRLPNVKQRAVAELPRTLPFLYLKCPAASWSEAGFSCADTIALACPLVKPLTS